MGVLRCGNATQSRNRTILRQDKWNGKPCTGEWEEVVSCVLPSCVQQWSIYGAPVIVLLFLTIAITIWIATKKKKICQKMSKKENEDMDEEKDGTYDQVNIMGDVGEALPLSMLGSASQHHTLNHSQFLTSTQNPYYDGGDLDLPEMLHEALTSNQNPYYGEVDSGMLSNAPGADENRSNGNDRSRKAKKRKDKKSTDVAICAQNPNDVQIGSGESRHANTNQDLEVIKKTDNVYYEL